LYASKRKSGHHQKEQTMQFSEVQIVTSSALSVQSPASVTRKQTRHNREDIPSAEVDPTLRAFGRHIAHCLKKKRRIAHCLKKKRRIRIPAMCGSDWGHVLRTLELKRAFN